MKPPQNEMPFANDSFRLEQEQTTDHARLARENQQRAADRAKSEQQQTNLFHYENNDR